MPSGAMMPRPWEVAVVGWIENIWVAIATAEEDTSQYAELMAACGNAVKKFEERGWEAIGGRPHSSTCTRPDRGTGQVT
jgi:hypothetical protein